MERAQNRPVLLVHSFSGIGSLKAGRLHIFIVGGQGEFGEVLFLLHDEDLGRARRDRLLHLLQLVQGWMFLEQLHDAITLALIKYLARSQDAGSTGNTSIP
jgi:hypothetical protein